MRILIIISFLAAVFSINVSAVEPVDEQQIMLYYQIPLGGVTQQESKHQFGLRFDQVTHVPGEDVHISTLAGRTAAMDFRAGYDGIKSLKIRGVDYASYLIARAAEEDKAPAETAPATTETTPAETAPAEGAKTETTESTETAEAPQAEKGPVQQKLDALPFGVVIGVIIGIGFIAGVGG